MLNIVEVNGVVSDILLTKLRPFGVKLVKISTQRDHDDDPLIVAELAYKKGALGVDPMAVTDAAAEAMRALREKGDERFILVRHRFDDDDAALDEDGGSML